MPIGPGKYDDLATYVREQSNASGVAVIIFGGTRGAGFAVQGTFEFNASLPSILRQMADEIERSGGSA
jgi:hypothetical protein